MTRIDVSRIGKLRPELNSYFPQTNHSAGAPDDVAYLELIDRLVVKHNTAGLYRSSARIEEHFQATPFGLPESQQLRSDVIVICVQHLLDTTASLFKYFIDLGIRADNIYVLGKNYSTCVRSKDKMCRMGLNVQNSSPQQELGKFKEYFQRDIELLYKRVIDDINAGKNVTKIILLDDGGRLIHAVPDGLKEICLQKILGFDQHRELMSKAEIDRHLSLCMIAIEQTTAGFRDLIAEPPPFMWLSVASSELKKTCEPFFIATVVFKKLNEIVRQIKSDVAYSQKRLIKCGLIGLGAIGKALAKELVANGYNVSYYDPDVAMDAELAHKASSVEQLIIDVDCVIGCTGLDTLESLSDIEIEKLLNKDKVFISCSSEDKEFKRLLEFFQQKCELQINDPLADIVINLEQARVKIVRGGFPINFDNSEHSVPAENIAITRALILSLVVGALSWNNYRSDSDFSTISREPPRELEEIITRNWAQLNPLTAKKLASRVAVSWIADTLGSIMPTSIGSLVAV